MEIKSLLFYDKFMIFYIILSSKKKWTFYYFEKPNVVYYLHIIPVN